VEEVGIVSGASPGGWLSSSSDRVLRAMRERARRMGGDAIVGLTSSDVPEAVVQTVPGVGGSSATRVLRGTVVRFADRACTE
jgi:uncharacterized protein YbjQ (UPF0145 family)